MAEDAKIEAKRKAADEKAARLAEALRANLRRRKAQGKARERGDDETEKGG